jgi:hypothetical protein
MGLEDYTEMEATMELLPTWIIFLVVSILVEGLVLKGLNRPKGWSIIFSASLVMNFLTYILLFAYTYYYL